MTPCPEWNRDEDGECLDHPPGTCTSCGHRWADHHEQDGCGACALIFTRSCKQWPAEAQQDDELLAEGRRLVYNVLTLPEEHQVEVGADMIARSLAARPSAGTETLLASVLRKLMAADSFLALGTHRSDTGFPVQFTLDDTTIEVTDAEADAIKATVGW